MLNFLKKDEPIKINFVFDQERMAVKYIKIWRRLRQGLSVEPEADTVQFLARFMVDKNGQYLPEHKAIEVLDELSPKEFREASEKFMQAVNETIIPKASGGNSISQQEAGLRETPPNG